jgi:hypothetical protein
MADAKVIVSAENRLKQGLDDAKKDLLGFGDAAESIGEKLKNALTVTAIVVGLEKLGKAAFDCFVEFGEGERRIKQLKIALDNNETSFNRAIRLIDEMRGMSLASKDQIEGLVAELATLGKSDAEIDRITRAAVNLSNVTGQDLNTAFTLINGTYSGTAGKLEKLIPELADLTKEQLAAGGAADIINGKFGEMSKQLAEDNIPQKIKNIRDNWDDLKQNFGQAVAPLFNPILEGINRIITGWNKAAEAADLHYKVLRATSFTEKISLTENLKQNAQERLRLWDQSNSATVERIQKNINSPYIDPSAKRAAQDALATLMAQRDAIVTELNTYAATITDLNKQWTQTPASLLNPRDLIKPVDLLGIPRGTTGGTSTSTSGGTTTGGTGGAGTAPVLDAIGSLLKGTIAGPEDYYFLQQALGNQQLSAPSLPYFEPVNYTAPTTLLQELSDIYSQSDDMIVGAITGLPASITDGVSTVVEPYSNALSELMAGMTDAESYRPVVDAIDGLNGNLLAYQESLLLNYAPPKTQADELSEIYAQSDDMIVGAVLGLPAGIMDGVSTVVESYSDNLSDAFAGAIDAGLTQPITQGLQDLNTNFLTFEESFLTNFAPPKTQAQELSDIYGASGVDMVGGGTGLAVSTAAGGVETPMLAPISGFDKLISAITPFADSLLGMITPLASIQAILNPIQTILQAAFGVLEPVINSVIAPLTGILAIIGQTLGAVLAPILKALSPIIELVGKAFVWLYNSVIRPIANALIWVFTAVQNAIAGVINAFTWLTGISAQYASYEDAKLQKIEYGDVVQAGANAAGATAAQSAQYRSQSITINIYQQSPVVGDGGMRQFAAMIRTEFEALAYYGT